MMLKKPTKITPKAPRGFCDLDSKNIRLLQKIISIVSHTFELSGFEPIELPFIDYTKCLGKFLPDHDRPNDGIFSLQDDDEEWLSLRYDLTAPLARFVAENYERLPKPYRSYRSGWVFRNEKPGPDRFRQFMQIDADTIGSCDVAADVEMITLMSDLLENLGCHRNEYVIKINHRKLLNGLLESINVEQDPSNDTQKLTILRAIDKLDKVSIEGVIALLGKGRWDENVEGQGNFIKGAQLSTKQIDKIIAFISHTQEMPHFFNSSDYIDQNESSYQAMQDLERMYTILKETGYHADRIVIDTSVVRGLEYYTGPVYEADLLDKIPNNEGQMVRFGSISGGGRYDNLLLPFRESSVPATGFSIGVSRLITALIKTGKLEEENVLGPVVVLAMGKEAEHIAQQNKIVFSLRKSGIASELYLGEGSMKAQMRYADRRNAPCVVIQGEEERKLNILQIKDLAAGIKYSEEIHDNKEWRAKRPGQITIPEHDLIPTVTRILSKQAGKISDIS